MDRVSNLPDELLCQVLSLLTTKEAALTSVLSKRWRNLIAFVPNLDISDSVFLNPEEGKRDRPEIIQSFMDFVDRILVLQGDSPIKKFAFKCRTAVDSVRLDGWISNVLARGVSDLDLAILVDVEEDDNYHYQLSPKCFQSSTLVRLKIDYGTDLCWVAGSVFLPVLKTLILEAVQLQKFEIFLSALPALEELVLVDINWQDMNVIVSNASLKTLKIDIDDGLTSLSFDTPSLVYFQYYGYIASDYPVVNMPSLLDAQIIFSLTEEHIQRVREPGDDNDVALGYSNVWKFFRGLQNVPNLYLSSDTLGVLSLCCESMPVFNNLKSLAIKSDKDRRWQAMPVLLRNCPHSETLVIEGLVHDVTDKCGDACDCIIREDKGLSLASCPVKLLAIQGFRGTMKEMHMIKHFLDYFPYLKNMEIFIEEDDPTQLKNPEISNLVVEMFQLYNKLSSCNVQLLVSDYLDKKWIEQGAAEQKFVAVLPKSPPGI